MSEHRLCCRSVMRRGALGKRADLGDLDRRRPDPFPNRKELAHCDEVSSSLFGAIHRLVAATEKFFGCLILAASRCSNADCDLHPAGQSGKIRNLRAEPFRDLLRLFHAGVPQQRDELLAADAGERI